MSRMRSVVLAGLLAIAACGDDTTATTTTAGVTTTTVGTTTTPAPTTTTTTTTTTEAVPDEPTVEFDGMSCIYEGPDRFEGGGLVAFHVLNTGDTDYGFILLRIDESLDYETVATLMDGFQGIGPELPEGITERSGSGIVSPGGEETPSVPLNMDGNYLPACQTWPANDWFVSDGFVVITGA